MKTQVVFQLVTTETSRQFDSIPNGSLFIMEEDTAADRLNDTVKVWIKVHKSKAQRLDDVFFIINPVGHRMIRTVSLISALTSDFAKEG